MDARIMALLEKLRAITELKKHNDVLAAIDLKHHDESLEQHEESFSMQKRFSRIVKAVYLVLQNKGSPFIQESGPSLKSYSYSEDVMMTTRQNFCVMHWS